MADAPVVEGCGDRATQPGDDCGQCVAAAATCTIVTVNGYVLDCCDACAVRLADPIGASSRVLLLPNPTNRGLTSCTPHREVAEGAATTVRARYRQLMIEHGYLIPAVSGHCCFGGCDECETCGGCRNSPLFGGCTCGSGGCRTSSFGLDPS